MNCITFLCVFGLIYTALAIQPGNYRQCDLNTGDEIFLDIGPAPRYATEMTFKFGGCLDGEVQYEIDAAFDIEIQGDRDDGGMNVAYHYRSAVATAYTSKALDALQNTCGNRFALNVPQNVLGCLFCPTRYDIYKLLENGIFVLGDGITCNEQTRPTQYEESKYVLLPYYNEYDDDDDVSTANSFTGTFSYVNADDDLEDDFYADEDDEILANDDDNDYVPITTDLSTALSSVLNTFSNSPVSSESAASTLVALTGVCLAVAFILI